MERRSQSWQRQRKAKVRSSSSRSSSSRGRRSTSRARRRSASGGLVHAGPDHEPASGARRSAHRRGCRQGHDHGEDRHRSRPEAGLARLHERVPVVRQGDLRHFARRARRLRNHPEAARARTVEAKAVATAKRAATRAARHTMGSKQKKGIKGDVADVVVTPVTAAPSTVRPESSPTAPATSVGTTAAATPRTP